jgi:hypothetical protein
MLKDMAGKKLAVGLKKSDATGQWQTSDEQTESELRLGLGTVILRGK